MIFGDADCQGKIRPQGFGASGAVPPGELALVADIASSNKILKKFLDAILGDLRNAGIVQSRKGKGGGYRLARPPEEIKVGSIVRVLDGPLAPIPCASHTRYEACDDCDVATSPGPLHHAQRSQRHRRSARSHDASQMRDASGEVLPLELQTAYGLVQLGQPFLARLDAERQHASRRRQRGTPRTR